MLHFQLDESHLQKLLSAIIPQKTGMGPPPCAEVPQSASFWAYIRYQSEKIVCDIFFSNHFSKNSRNVYSGNKIALYALVDR